MINEKRTNEDRGKFNLMGNYKMAKRNTKKNYKAKNNRMYPTKMSSSNFLLLKTLFLLNKNTNSLYGKEMLEEIQRDVCVDIWQPSHGTYYPVLDVMMEAGYINNVKVISGKKFYEITKLGIKELECRLVEFRPMLIESCKFFSNIFTEMYNDNQANAVAATILQINDKLDTNSNN
ncbi:PadR family transcriptional regulator [Clostridium estertheticum]|uniref:PadR family transcriptional regulator n=1 Tax=Clostridium estertheticum TaxID=238834 RepID=UPI001C0CD836|nr:PadR family transcriptional regulator [Clostridium estertheticum]MBU3173703.1 PadR family transcriptional regulator [Clostridium estertheticum]